MRSRALEGLSWIGTARSDHSAHTHHELGSAGYSTGLTPSGTLTHVLKHQIPVPRRPRTKPKRGGLTAQAVTLLSFVPF